MPLTDKGFERLTFDEILERQESRAKELFGEDVDVSSKSVLGKFVRLICSDIDELYQSLEACYYARFPNTASGTSLERLCVFAGISRNPATFAQHTIKLIGEPGALVELGFEVSDQLQEVTFYTIDDVTIGSDGVAYAKVECSEAGTQGNLSIGDINSIVSPIAEVDSIEHISIDYYGSDNESDYSLRKRFEKAVNGSGETTESAISGAITRAEGVAGVYIKENDTSTTVDGVPPHSFECFVLAPESKDNLIAQAIFDKKPIGIQSYGDVTVDVVDVKGETHKISFTHTQSKDVYIKVQIKIDNDEYPDDGESQIKENLVDYIATLVNGEELYISALYGLIHDVPGVVTVSSLTLSTDGKVFKAENITCELSSIIRTNASLINIEVV